MNTDERRWFICLAIALMVLININGDRFDYALLIAFVCNFQIIAMVGGQIS